MDFMQLVEPLPGLRKDAVYISVYMHTIDSEWSFDIINAECVC